MHQSELHPKDKAKEYERIFKDHIVAGGAAGVEMEIITSKGVEIPVEVNAGLMMMEGKQYILGTFRDITERKVKEALIKESELKYRSLFENMATGFAYHQLVYDKAGNPIDYIFIEVNNEFEELTGLGREQVIGKKVTEAIPGIEKDEFDWVGTYGKVAKEGGSITLEDQYSKQLDRWYTIVAYSPRRDYFATVFVDVTERKKIEERLQEALGKYEKSNKDLRRLNNFMVGREVKMRELKKEIRRLKVKLGEE